MLTAIRVSVGFVVSHMDQPFRHNPEDEPEEAKRMIGGCLVIGALKVAFVPFCACASMHTGYPCDVPLGPHEITALSYGHGVQNVQWHNNCFLVMVGARAFDTCTEG